jgi:hypothetical protein
MWVFFKGEQQPTNWPFSNQIMQCVVCCSEVMGLKVLAFCIKLWKGFIAYPKSNGITSMKKHVKIEYNVVLK